MTEVIAFDDAEALTIQHLSGVLTDALVTSDAPNSRTGLLVTVQRIGGLRANLVTDSPILVFQCWADSKADAYDLCRLVRAHVLAMEQTLLSGVWIYEANEVGGPGYLPEPDDGTPRYQFTAQLRLRGKAI